MASSHAKRSGFFVRHDCLITSQPCAVVRSNSISAFATLKSVSSAPTLSKALMKARNGCKDEPLFLDSHDLTCSVGGGGEAAVLLHVWAEGGVTEEWTV